MAQNPRKERARERVAQEQAAARSQESARLAWKIALALAIAAWVVYLLTLYPTIPGGDSGELITAAHRLGVAHPPGYPLYTILAKLFTFIPIGTVAWRVNLFSATCDAAAAALLALSVSRWVANPWAGLLSGGLFAFSPLVWRYAVGAEVFALNHLLLTGMLYALVRFSENRAPRYAYLFALLFGLGLSNHHTSLFYGLPFAMWILWIGSRDLFHVGRLGAFAGFFVLGLVPYVYLPLASLRDEMISWGDATSLTGFLTHVLRREYGTFRLGASGGESQFLPGIFHFLKELPGQSLYAGTLLAIFGLLYLHSRKWAVAILLRGRADRGANGDALLADPPAVSALGKVTVFAFLFYVIVFHALANLPLDDPYFYDIHSRFWPQANLLVFAWAGIGLHALTSTGLKSAYFAAAAISLVVAQAALHYRSEDQSRNIIFHRMAETILQSLPENSLLLCYNEAFSNSLRYLQFGAGIRLDVVVLDRELLGTPWMNARVRRLYPKIALPGNFYRIRPDHMPGLDGGYSLKDFLDRNYEQFPVFACAFGDEEREWEKTYSAWSYGFISRMVRMTEKLDPQKYLEQSSKFVGAFDPDVFARIRVRTGSWEDYVRDHYWEGDYRRGRDLVNYAYQRGNQPEFLRAGIQILETLASRHPQPPAVLFQSLGAAYDLLRAAQPAAEAGMIKWWNKYLEVGPASDPQMARIRSKLAQVSGGAKDRASEGGKR